MFSLLKEGFMDCLKSSYYSAKSVNFIRNGFSIRMPEHTNEDIFIFVDGRDNILKSF